jgi:hypothetical protein
MLTKLRIANYRFTLKARDELHLPPYKGSTLRGGFGHAFKQVVCLQRQAKTCEGCLLRENCPYAYIFDTSPPPDAEVLRTHSDVPLPFVIEPDTSDRRTTYPPGDTLNFELILVGKAINYLPYFILVFRELGDRGLGRGRGKYRLQEVEAVQPLSGDKERIYSAADEMVCHSQLEVGFQDIERRAEEIPGDTVILRFLTPTRIKHQGSFISQPPFHVIVRNVLRRVSSLYYFHCGEQWEFDYRGTIERAKEIRSAELNTQWIDWERYSGRQKTRLKMGGFVGEAVYEGDLTEFRPLLLLGQLVHIGKACVFGNGRYEISTR